MNSEDIIQAVCDVTGVSPQGLKSPLQSYAFSRPRQLAYFLMRDLLALQVKTIGEALGRDHTTVCHGLKRAAELLETNQAFREWHGKVIERMSMERAA